LWRRRNIRPVAGQGLPERAVEDVLWAYRDRMLDLKNEQAVSRIRVDFQESWRSGGSLDRGIRNSAV